MKDSAMESLSTGYMDSLLNVALMTPIHSMSATGMDTSHADYMATDSHDYTGFNLIPCTEIMCDSKMVS